MEKKKAWLNLNVWLTAFQIIIWLSVLSLSSSHTPALPNLNPLYHFAFQSGWIQQKQVTDVTDYAGHHSPAWREGGHQSLRSSPGYSPSSPSQVNTLFRFDFSKIYTTYWDISVKTILFKP